MNREQIEKQVFNEDHEDALKVSNLLEGQNKEELGKKSEELLNQIEREKDCGKNVEDSEIRDRLKGLHCVEYWYNNSEAKSEDLLETMKNMWTSTGIYQNGHTLNKIFVALEIGDYIEKENEIKNLPVYYLGANKDFHFPLTSRFRNIKMVDPCYEDNKLVEEIIEELSEYEDFEIVENNDNSKIFHFNFDFGKGKKEKVKIELINQTGESDDYEKEDTGGVISFFTGDAAMSNRSLYEKLKRGGVVFDSNEYGIFYSLATDKYQQEIFGETEEFGIDKDYENKERILHDKEVEIAKDFGFKTVKIKGTSYSCFIKEKESEEWRGILENIKNKRDEES
jgi:hypothetical protein